MPSTIYRVMISSTTKDLPDHRKAALDAIMRVDMKPEAMEFGTAMPGSDAIKFSLDMVDTADVYVGIFGFRYGYRPVDAARNKDNLSVTELEYRRAKERGIPVLLFVMDEAHPRVVGDISKGDDLVQMERLRDELGKEIVAFFKSLEDMGMKMLHSLMLVKAKLDKPTGADDAKKKIADPVTPRVTGERQMRDKLPLLDAVALLGRAADVAVIRTMLTEAPTQILGVGGLGKTRLAAEIARAWEQGAVWHECSDTSRADGVLEGLREHYGLPLTTSEADTYHALAQNPVLVVLDNAELIEDDDERRRPYSALVQQLYERKAQILITSRVAWDEVKPRRQYSPQTLPLETAAQLAQDIARALGIESTVAPIATELAQAARQHPRLIDLAVNFMSEAEPATILRRLRELTHKSMQDALEEMVLKTLRQMTEQADNGATAETLLTRLVVFRGGFTRDAAAAIGNIADEDEFADALAALRRWRFVRMDEATNRYSIEEVVISAVAHDTSAYQPHYEFYKVLANQHNEKQDYAGLDVESENITAAYERKVEAKEYEAAFWLAWECYEFLLNRGRSRIFLTWIEQVAPVLLAGEKDALKGSVNNILGNAYTDLAKIEDRGDNLRRAIDCYENALRYRTPETAPLEYASTQSNLGTAYSDLAKIEDPVGNLRRAIACYENALRYRTPETAPLDYAMTQNNLGNTYLNLAKIEDQTENLRRAIVYYENALRYWTPATAPLAYAMTQNNLGIAYSDLAKIEDRVENLRRAIDCYENALRYRTPETAPLNYAATQNNLGIAYGVLASIEDRADNLRRAIACYENALHYYTPATAPGDYAMTQHNLGIVYETSGNLAQAIVCWREAEKYYRLMGYNDNADLVLRWIEQGEQDLKAADEGDEES